jgi:hypothetical protein
MSCHPRKRQKSKRPAGEFQKQQRVALFEVRFGPVATQKSGCWQERWWGLEAEVESDGKSVW